MIFFYLSICAANRPQSDLPFHGNWIPPISSWPTRRLRSGRLCPQWSSKNRTISCGRECWKCRTEDVFLCHKRSWQLSYVNLCVSHYVFSLVTETFHWEGFGRTETNSQDSVWTGRSLILSLLLRLTLFWDKHLCVTNTSRKSQVVFSPRALRSWAWCWSEQTGHWSLPWRSCCLRLSQTSCWSGLKPSQETCFW